MENDEKKKISPLTLIAGAGGSVTSMLAGSAFGIEGTVIGAAAGSVISGVAVILYERAVLRAKDKLRKHLKPSDEDATSLIPAIRVRRSQRKWLLAAAGALMTVISAAAAFGLLGIVRGASGTTPGNDTPLITPQRTESRPAVTVTPAVTITPAVVTVPSPSFSEPPRALPSLSPHHTASASPSLSPSPPSPSPAPSPSLVPGSP
jgi:hypothetical protein